LYKSWQPDLEEGKKLNDSNKFWSNDSTMFHSLWQKLVHLEDLERIENKDTILNSWVQIDLINDNEILATLYDGKSMVDKLSFYGRIENDVYFVTNQNHKRMLIPLIWYQNLNTQYIFYLDKYGDLVLHGLEWNEGAILIMGGSGGGNMIKKYKRKD